MNEATEDQAQEAGLPPRGGYQVSGMLLDAEGEPVELPRVVGTLTVPLRWLHPRTRPSPPSRRDASVRGNH